MGPKAKRNAIKRKAPLSALLGLSGPKSSGKSSRGIPFDIPWDPAGLPSISNLELQEEKMVINDPQQLVGALEQFASQSIPLYNRWNLNIGPSINARNALGQPVKSIVQTHYPEMITTVMLPKKGSPY